jgi:hypothetical protein
MLAAAPRWVYPDTGSPRQSPPVTAACFMGTPCRLVTVAHDSHYTARWRLQGTALHPGDFGLGDRNPETVVPLFTPILTP